MFYGSSITWSCHEVVISCNVGIYGKNMIHKKKSTNKKTHGNL